MLESLATAQIWSREIGPIILMGVLNRFNEEGIDIRTKSRVAKPRAAKEKYVN